jgi:hypothetical protein
MSFSLEKFEARLPKDIVEKGHAYFTGFLVEDLTQDGDRWQADVYGSTNYTVDVVIKEGEVVSWFCDCPYDWGPICKHVTAVLFAIRDGEPAGPGEIAPKSVKKTAKQKAKDAVEEIIAGLNETELREVLLYLAGREEDVKAFLLSKYTDRLEQTSKADFKQLVQAVIKAHKGGPYGFIDYHSSGRLGAQLYKLLAEVSGEWSTIYLCEEVIEQAASIIQHADDSMGSIGGAISSAFQHLFALFETESSISAKGRKYLLKLSLSQHDKNKFDGFDWGDDFRHLASLAINNKKEAEQFVKVLETYITAKEQEKYGRYSLQRAARRKLEILEKWFAKEEARTYLLNNLHLPDFRKKELENALREGRLADVRRLAEEGITLDTETGLRGLVLEWKKWLVRWAEAAGDDTALIELTEKMFLSTSDMAYYRRVKEMLSKEEFALRIAAYLKHFSRYDDRFGGFNHQSAAILVEEGRHEALMQMILKSPQLNVLDQYRELLAKDYRTEYLQSYEAAVRNKMQHAGNRAAYQDCCRYLNLMIQLGGREQVRQIISDWKVEYPRRRAMLEELAGVELF